MQRTRHYIITTVALLLFGLLAWPFQAQALTATIYGYFQWNSANTLDEWGGFSDLPPAGALGDETYVVDGTPGPLGMGGELTLNTALGVLDGGVRVVGASAFGTDSAPVFLTSGSQGNVGAHFQNVAPTLGSGYGIFIENQAGSDSAYLVIWNDGALKALFWDETTNPASPISFQPLTSGELDGLSEIELELALYGSTVTAWIYTSLDAYELANNTTLEWVGGAYSGGFGAAEVIPEPGTLLLLGSGLLGVGAWVRRRSRV